MTFALLFFAGWAGEARAVEVTDMPDGLRGDATLTYEGTFGRHTLVQDQQVVGQRRINDHTLRVQVEFAPVDGISLYLALPTTLSRTVRFPEAFEMMLDPATGQGRFMTGSPITEPPETSGSGGLGVWFGVGFAPYAERYNTVHQLTWRLDLAARTRTEKSFWEENDGRRGAAQGGAAYRISGAFSAENGGTRPYMAAKWTMETRREVSVITGSESTQIQVKPGSTFSLLTGVEALLLRSESASSVEPYFDFSAGFGYRSSRDIPSGILLPDVLETMTPIAVTQTSALTGQLGLGFGLRFPPHVQWRTGLSIRAVTPYQIEDIYPVKSGANAIDLLFSTALSVGVR
jgi:hypothetical protein